MVCPKCNNQIPEDSVFCPNCGCNIEETKKQISLEMEKSSHTEIKTITIVKNEKSKKLIALLIIFIVICIGLGYYSISLYNKNEKNSELIKEYKTDINILETKNSNLENTNDYLSKKVNENTTASEALITLQSYDNWGYATENFHANTGVICAKSYGKKEMINIIMNYSNTTCTVDYSDRTVANVYWSDKTWNYGEAAEVYIEPKSKGVCVLTFTNDAYKSTFKVLVIVT